MSFKTPTPLPQYIYKIFPSSLPPVPVPQTTSFPLHPLDARDGFIHLSTSSQILHTLQAFFSSDESVYILRITYSNVAEYIKWEDVHGKEPDEQTGEWSVDGEKGRGFFPHIYGNRDAGKGCGLGLDEIKDFGVWRRGRDGWTSEDWPWKEDIPK